MKQKAITTNRKVTGYTVAENCTLDYTNFEAGDIIEIPIDDCPHDWKGIEWFENYPQIFIPIYDTPSLLKENKQLKERIKDLEDSAIIDMAFNPLKEHNQQQAKDIELLRDALQKLTSEVKLGKLNIRKDFELINAHANGLKALKQTEPKQ